MLHCFLPSFFFLLLFRRGVVKFENLKPLKSLQNSFPWNVSSPGGIAGSMKSRAAVLSAFAEVRGDGGLLLTHGQMADREHQRHLWVYRTFFFLTLQETWEALRNGRLGESYMMRTVKMQYGGEVRGR